MTTKEIITLVKQIKMLLPTISIPEFDGKSKEEQNSMLAIYIMQFGNLNYNITLNALNKIIQDEEKMKRFAQAPIPTLTRESVSLTQFTEQEKEKYRLEQKVDYFHDPLHKGIMFAANARTWKAMPEYDRPMTPLEEDYYDNKLMSEEEYLWWKRGKDEGKPKPRVMRYDPHTRTNTLNVKLDVTI